MKAVLDDVRWYANEWDGTTAGDMIRAQVRQLDVSFTVVADRAGVSNKHLSMVVCGHVGLTPQFAMRLEQELGIPAERLLFADVRRRLYLARTEA